MLLDLTRHLTVFSPHAFGSRRVDVIGVGATGSRIALSLAKLGIANIHIWDDDRVESHNIPNQAYTQEHIGELKVRAMQSIVAQATGATVAIHPSKVDGSQELGEVVFLLVDRMDARRLIWEGSLKYKLRTQIVIETRMGSDAGRIYTVNPNRQGHIASWESTLCQDDEAEVSACGASISVGPTAEVISGLAVWQLLRWFAIENGSDDELDNEILFGLRPIMTLSRQF